MLYLYMDESGDLGFDFVNKKPSAFFTVCVLAVRGQENDRRLAGAVKAVIRRKVYPKQKNGKAELKGSELPIEVKRYFYGKAREIPFKLYGATLNKKKACGSLMLEKERLYNYMARLALEKVDLRDAAIRVIVTVDKRLSKQGIAEFNRYMLAQLKAQIDPLVPLDIYHVSSQESPGLQAADLFAWGIFRSYEAGDASWYGIFREKIAAERNYEGKKEEERAGQAHRPGS
jgi:hypothetical protein